MNVVQHDSKEAFLARASGWLLTNAAENNLPLGIARGVDSSIDEAFFATVEDGPQILLAAVWTPPHRVILTRAEEPAVHALADFLRARSPSGVLGPSETARAFASRWEKLSGATLRTAFEERLYALRKVIPPRSVPGRVRCAEPNDLEIVAEWWFRFAIDAGLEPTTLEEAREAAETRIAGGSIFLWDDGEPRSMACLTRPSTEAIAVGYVYTPDDQRGHGYAKSCVAAVSQIGLDRGHNECVLYADLANSISNQIYTSIGYVPVTDILLIDFL